MNLISKLKTLLHVGCASLNISHLKGFIIDDWTEIRFDIDESRNPDIVGTLTDMSLVQTESVDAIYSAYNIDHIYPHEVPTALSEFFRVLKDDGMAIIKCPDIQSVCEAVAKGKLLEPFYNSPVGPISPIDILFGNRKAVAKGNEFMAKKGGFIYSVLDRALHQAGFEVRYGGRVKNGRELSIVAFKQKKPEEEIKNIANPFF
ncbi:class I SAM-dependent methyltransferase [Candidatus Pseudothioglobus singularis]|nr:class I SAM-dependent methyltransferase [Candidatus Pseudothioglobus singularis]